MRRATDRRNSTFTQAELLDVSIWVSSQRRGSADLITQETISKDLDKHWEKGLREVGIFWGGSLIMQTVVGPGIFTSPKGVMSGSGSVGLNFIIWAACGIFSTLAALCFAELQIFVRRAGCEYGYIHKAYGPLPAFIYTWMRIVVAEPCTTAVFAVAFAQYVNDSIGYECMPDDLIKKLLSFFAILTLAILNTYNIELSRQMASVSNIAKIVTISIIIVCGIYRTVIGKTELPGQLFENTQRSDNKIVFAVYNSLWAYGGWSNVPSVTAGVKKPPKNLPRLVKIVIPTVTIIYLSSVYSYLTVISPQELAKKLSFGVEWGDKMLGEAAFVIPIGVAIVALGNANNTFMASGKLSSVSVQDGYVPEFLTYKHVKTKSHLPAILLRAIAASIMAMYVPVQMMVRFWIFTVWLFHGLSVLGLIVMRIRKPHIHRPYKVNIVIPFIVFIGAAYVVISPFTVIPLEPEFIFSLVMAVLAVVIYVPFVKWNWSNRLAVQITIFLQLLMNVVPGQDVTKRQRNKKKRSKKSTNIAPIDPPSTENTRNQQNGVFERQDSTFSQPGDLEDSYSVTYSDDLTFNGYQSGSQLNDSGLDYKINSSSQQSSSSGQVSSSSQDDEDTDNCVTKL